MNGTPSEHPSSGIQPSNGGDEGSGRKSDRLRALRFACDAAAEKAIGLNDEALEALTVAICAVARAESDAIREGK